MRGESIGGGVYSSAVEYSPRMWGEVNLLTLHQICPVQNTPLTCGGVFIDHGCAVVVCHGFSV